MACGACQSKNNNTVLKIKESTKEKLESLVKSKVIDKNSLIKSIKIK